MGPDRAILGPRPLQDRVIARPVPDTVEQEDPACVLLQTMEAAVVLGSRKPSPVATGGRLRKVPGDERA